MVHAIKNLLFFTPHPQGGSFVLFPFVSFCVLSFIGRSPLKDKIALLENVFVRMSLYHARALCARGKSDKMAKH